MASLIGVAPTATEGLAAGSIPALAGGGSPVEPVLSAGGTVGRTGALGSTGAGSLWRTLTTPMDQKTLDNLSAIASMIAKNRKDVPPPTGITLPARGGVVAPPTATQFMSRGRPGGVEALLRALGVA